MKKTKGISGTGYKKLVALIGIYFFTIGGILAAPKYAGTDSLHTSTRSQALAFINEIKGLPVSKHWPNIKPALFLQNLKTNVSDPMTVYPGSSTNFCGYGALTYLLLEDDPLGYARLLLDLYKDGKASFGKAVFAPTETIKIQAGQLKFKGILDIRPAEQMWYLVLADHFKGYLNIFNHKYDPGDENTFWASVNYAKFNRMLRTLLNYNVRATGADLMHPRVGDLYTYISNKLTTGAVVLFINNRIVHKKNHVQIKAAVPTHFIVLKRISKTDDLVTMVYWDYGSRTLLQLSPNFLRKIIFGITICTKNNNAKK